MYDAVYDLARVPTLDIGSDFHGLEILLKHLPPAYRQAVHRISFILGTQPVSQISALFHSETFPCLESLNIKWNPHLVGQSDGSTPIETFMKNLHSVNAYVRADVERVSKRHGGGASSASTEVEVAGARRSPGS